MQHNALVRIDIKVRPIYTADGRALKEILKMWRYNFSGKGVMSEHENGEP
jgi:hypothetical protein